MPEILFCDGDIVVCVKPAGLDSEHAMPRELAEGLGGKALCVHRLDAGVSGVMVYARNAESAAALSRSFAGRGAEKRYLAVLNGCPAEPEGILRDLIYHDARSNKSFVVQRERRGVREAALSYRVLESRGALSLVEVTLLTGRSHQIRVQFASRKMPLAGDTRYGARGEKCPVALLSRTLSFPHPRTGEPMSLDCPIPDAYPWSIFASLQTGGGKNAELPSDAVL